MGGAEEKRLPFVCSGDEATHDRVTVALRGRVRAPVTEAGGAPMHSGSGPKPRPPRVLG